MKKILLSVVLVTSLMITSNAQTGLHVPQLAAFDNAMLKLMSDFNVPGAQLAITYRGRLVYNRGFGLANTATRDSVYPNSMFRIASVSKTLTGAACMKLFEQGLLKLDAKVFGANGILNDEIYQNILDPRVKDITVRMLLHHTGGWNLNISGDPMFNAFQIATEMGVTSPPSESVVIQHTISKRMLDFTPGTQYQYSNFGYCVLGRVIEKITGLTYQKYVLDNILTPLGMINTKLGSNLLADKLPNEVNYYDYPGAPLSNSIYDNTTKVSRPYGGFNIEFLDAAGGWVSSCEDLLRFVCAIDRFNTRPDILKVATLDTMVKASTHNRNYASGISVNANNNWWHMGSLSGTTSAIVRNGSQQINWAILLNTRDASMNINTAVDRLVWDVLPSITNWPGFDLFANTTTDINDITIKSNTIAVYPNPTENNINFSVPANVQLINQMGRTVAIKKNVNSIDLSDLPSGIYFGIFRDNMEQVLQRTKIVKM